MRKLTRRLWNSSLVQRGTDSLLQEEIVLESFEKSRKKIAMLQPVTWGML